MLESESAIMLSDLVHRKKKKLLSSKYAQVTSAASESSKQLVENISVLPATHYWQCPKHKKFSYRISTSFFQAQVDK